MCLWQTWYPCDSACAHMQQFDCEVWILSNQQSKVEWERTLPERKFNQPPESNPVRKICLFRVHASSGETQVCDQSLSCD